MKIGSMFAGIGGLDLACEWAGLGSAAWQLDLTGADVRRRHWPDAVQVEADVTTVDPRDLPRVDVLCGGFPCQDLSVAGSGAGLDGARSGLYREVLRFGAALRPAVVVLENVPALLHYRERLEADWAGLGYGLTWVRARALDAGTPHLRARVFVVGQRGGAHRGVVEAPRDGAWTAEGDERRWATYTASEAKGRRTSLARRDDPDMLTEQVRPWPTPTAGDAKASGSRSLPGSGAHDGASLTDAIRPDRPVAGERPWPTPLGADADDVKHNGGRGNPSLNFEARQRPDLGRRLSPDWVETLMGFPVGWTRADGDRLDADPSPRWPRGRYPKGWDRTVHWPGYDWEPARTLPDGPPAPGRPARLRALGNAVCPQQGALAIRAALAGPRQGVLL